MVKLLRFKYSNAGVLGSDVRGFGKQPITIGAKSEIALKNYNIKLATTLENMVFTVGYTDDIVFGIYDGDAGITMEQCNLYSGTYNHDEIRELLEEAINSLKMQNSLESPRGYYTGVSWTEQNALHFVTVVCPVSNYDIEDENNFRVTLQSPGEVVLAGNRYDATNAGDQSESVIQNGDGVESNIIVGGDSFSFTIDNLAGDEGQFRFAVTLGDDFEQYENALWGIGFMGDEYVCRTNLNDEDDGWSVLLFPFVYPGPRPPLVPTVGDIMSYVRSGTTMTIRISRGVDPDFFSQTFNSYNAIPSTYLEPFSYIVRTQAPVIASNLRYAMSGLFQATQIETKCEDAPLGKQLGYLDATAITSVLSDPAEITLQPADGAVSYEGIMVCINGLDIETYDFAKSAEGKTNFLYTIQREPTSDGVASSSAAGDLTNEPYIDMNNESAVNINNKLSIYFLDTASGTKLQFYYADLLLIIR